LPRTFKSGSVTQSLTTIKIDCIAKARKPPGQRSVEAIVKTAATTRSHARIQHTARNGETLEVELTPIEAIEAAAQQDQAKEQATTLRDEHVLRRQLSAPEIRGAVARLQQADTQNLSSTETQSIVDIVVAVLQAAGAGHLLENLASELEMHGMLTFAEAVRQHIGPSRTQEPPLTTS
jgi:hypothetical protein